MFKSPKTKIFFSQVKTCSFSFNKHENLTVKGFQAACGITMYRIVLESYGRTET